ncbi:hypothetical protein NQ315_014874 [Exocentrus adspersus]|uniref:Peptidase aspartic putative domain-containing protein n=1 Tax=Exocentrus adspersus TaxID=1586481 RepID=A0AAV8VM32_9CUCU|nr:hypothetical protein NQ315_014874 [Exocentrus adspersus]
MSSKKDLTKLKAKITQVKTSMLKIQEFVSKNSSIDRAKLTEELREQLLARKQTFNSLFEKYQDICVDIICVDQDSQDDSDDSQDDIEALYFDIVSVMNKLLSEPPNVKSNSKNTSGKVSSSKLPDIDVPEFDGKNINNFKPFLALFTAGDALSVIINLPLENSSYEKALELLKHSHIKAILDMPAIQKRLSHCVEGLERTRKAKDNPTLLPTLEDFIELLEDSAGMFEESVSEKRVFKGKIQFTHLVNQKGENKACLFCSVVGHKLYNCEQFKHLSVNERISFVDKNKCCKTCLNKHADKCKLSFKCQNCRKNHNSLLHLDKSSDVPDPSSSTGETAQTNCYLSKNSDNVLLPTVQVNIIYNTKVITVRALVDSGSQTSFLTNEIVKKLNLKTYNHNLDVDVLGIAENMMQVKRATNVKVHSVVNDYNITSCQLRGNLPQFQINPATITIPKNIQLADNDFYKPKKIDLLLGANIFF